MSSYFDTLPAVAQTLSNAQNPYRTFSLNREDLLEDLLSEREDVTTQRRDCKEAISVLQAAMQALEVRKESVLQVRMHSERRERQQCRRWR